MNYGNKLNPERSLSENGSRDKRSQTKDNRHAQSE